MLNTVRYKLIVKLLDGLFLGLIALFFINELYSFFSFLIVILSMLAVFLLKKFDLKDLVFLSVLMYSFFSIFSEYINNSALSSYEEHLKVLLASMLIFSMQLSNLNYKKILVSILIMMCGSLSIALYQRYGLNIDRVGVKGVNAFSDISTAFGCFALGGLVYAKEKKHIAVGVVSIFIIISSYYISILAVNRGSWLSFPFIFAIGFSFLFRWHLKSVLAGLLMLFSLAFLIYSISDDVKVRIDASASELTHYFESDYSATSTGLRIEMLKYGVFEGIKKPVFGFGDDGEAENRAGIVGYNERISSFKHVHNEYVNIFIRNGVLSLVAFLCFIFFMIRYHLSNIENESRYVSIGCVSLLVHFLLVSMVNVKLEYNVGITAFVIVPIILYSISIALNSKKIQDDYAHDISCTYR